MQAPLLLRGRAAAVRQGEHWASVCIVRALVAWWQCNVRQTSAGASAQEMWAPPAAALLASYASTST